MLVVDDEVIARMVISEYLRNCGYKVIEAADVDEALHVLKQVEFDIAVVLCGIGNAGAAGSFALAQWLRSNRPGVEIILAGNHGGAANAAGELCEDGPKPRSAARYRSYQAASCGTRKPEEMNGCGGSDPPQ